jgi:putative ABC transport system permease protein
VSDFVLPRTLEVFGVRPAIGRQLGAADFESDAPGVVLLTEGAWRNYFDTDSSVVGRSIELDEQPFSVIGVMPSYVAEMR